MQQCDRGHCVVSRQNSICVMDDLEDEDIHILSGKSESEEEDYESFFLQPASSPYNIKEKIAEANKLLEEINLDDEKPIRVQFCEELVNFEPDLTDDDVQSIESYTEELITEELRYIIQDNKLCDIIEEDIIEESIIESIIELNQMSQLAAEEREEDERAISEEVFEEVLEDIEEEEIDDEVDLPQPPEEIPELENFNQELTVESLSENSSNIKDKPKKKKSTKKKHFLHEINCKKHCIEELESRLEMCISRLHPNDKQVCPTLKLHRRKCCGGGCKVEQKLPLYTGLHSEYGLSSKQIERLAKRKEIIKLKEEKEKEMSEAYRQRKIQQNEIIFRQWLKDISSRKQVEREREKEIISRNYISVRRTDTGIDSAEKRAEKQRPKTANCLTSVQLRLEGKTDGSGKRRRRPHTTSSSTSRIFIEISDELLAGGLKVGDLFIQHQNLDKDYKVKQKRLQLVSYS